MSEDNNVVKDFNIGDRVVVYTARNRYLREKVGEIIQFDSSSYWANGRMALIKRPGTVNVWVRVDNLRHVDRESSRVVVEQLSKYKLFYVPKYLESYGQSAIYVVLHYNEEQIALYNTRNEAVFTIPMLEFNGKYKPIRYEEGELVLVTSKSFNMFALLPERLLGLKSGKGFHGGNNFDDLFWEVVDDIFKVLGGAGSKQMVSNITNVTFTITRDEENETEDAKES